MDPYDMPEGSITFDSVGEQSVAYLIQVARKGIDFPRFSALALLCPFSMSEWSEFLHLSERTIQRYQKEKKSFDPAASGRIIEILVLYKMVISALGSASKANTWLDTESVALGGARPKELLDTSLGIQLLKEEILRIEHGVLA